MDRYYLACGHYEAKGYRLLWIRSSQKATQDVETRTRRIEKALEALKALQARLNRYNLKKRHAIEQAIHTILKEHYAQDWIDYEIRGERMYQRRYDQRGRPKASQKNRLIWTEHFSVSFGANEESVERESKTDGIFPIITNLDQSCKPKKILETYKFQPFLEKRHSQLKTWQEMTPVLLKKAERVVAYLHLHVMSLMVATLIERKRRRAMKHRSISSLPLYPEDRPCPYPTMFDLARVFAGVERYEVNDRDRVIVFPAKLNPLQKQLLELLEAPVSLYH